MKRLALVITVLAALYVAAPASAFSTFLSQKEAKTAIERRAAKATWGDSESASYYNVYGCWRITRGVVKCRVDFLDDFEDYLCGSVLRVKVYPHDPSMLYSSVTWSSC